MQIFLIFIVLDEIILLSSIIYVLLHFNISLHCNIFIIFRKKPWTFRVSNERSSSSTRWSDKSDATRCYALRLPDFVSASNLAQWHLINGHHLHTDSSRRRPQLNYLVNSAKAIVRQRNRIYPWKSSLKPINSTIASISMRINYLLLLFVRILPLKSLYVVP